MKMPAKCLRMAAMVCVWAVTACERTPISTPEQEAAGTARGYRDNALRKTVGLREIGPGWKCFRSLQGKDEWIIDQRSEAADKWVTYDASRTKLLDETDRWWTGRKFTTVDGEIDEMLRLTYDYGSGTFEFGLVTDDRKLERMERPVGNAEILKRADEILAKWGLSRQ